jgi:hypothetical protein
VPRLTQGANTLMTAPQQPANPPRQLVLVKKDQRWVFRYMPGEESAVLQWLARSAKDPASHLDWFDAAVLSHQMGDRIAQQLQQFKQGA